MNNETISLCSGQNNIGSGQAKACLILQIKHKDTDKSAHQCSLIGVFLLAVFSIFDSNCFGSVTGKLSLAMCILVKSNLVVNFDDIR